MHTRVWFRSPRFCAHAWPRKKKKGGRTNDAKRWIRKNCIRFAKVDQYSFRVSRSPPPSPPPSPPYPSSGVEFSLEEHVLTPDPFSRALPLTCLPLVRIFSNKSHADEKSTMAVAHKETRVFTMSSRCIETCRCWKFTGIFFFFSFCSSSSFFFFSFSSRDNKASTSFASTSFHF